MGVLKDYTDLAVASIMKMDPTLDEEKVREQVEHQVKLKVKDPTIYMQNDIVQKREIITLSKLFNWIDRQNPVCSGNATFYCQPEVSKSPTAIMLKEMKAERKKLKKDLFKQKVGTPEYLRLDLEQKNLKVVMNAEYGASGNTSAAFYNKYDPAATTTMAQSIITVMADFFEGLIGDNQKFFSANECFDWMLKVIKKDAKLPKWIRIPSKEEVHSRIMQHFIESNPKISNSVKMFIDNCNDEELTYLYYANNMKALIANHGKVISIFERILGVLPRYKVAIKEVPSEFSSRFPAESNNDHIDKYNKWIASQMFLDPNNIPEIIKEDVNKFNELVMQFVYVESITSDSIEKLNNHTRNTVLLVDTDSNYLNANIFVEFILDTIFPNITFGREKLYNEMIMTNMLAVAISKPIASLLDYYGRCHHMNKESRAELTMKNEFMLRRLFLMDVKKRYTSSKVLREGNIMIPFDTDVKGMDFIKAGVSEEVSKRFEKMLEDYILFPEEIDLHGMMVELFDLQKEVRKSLREGDMKYLKQQQFRPMDSYIEKVDKNGRVQSPWSQPVFRGVMAWNELYPNNKIYSLDRVKLVKTIVIDQKDLDKLKTTNKDWYDSVTVRIYNNLDQNLVKSGIQYICIPSGEKEIPEWIRPIIDYDIITSDTISSFKSVIESLKINKFKYKTPNGDAIKLNPLIEF